MAQGQLTLNTKLETAAGLARGMITASAVVPQDHPVAFTVPAGVARRLVRLRDGVDDWNALREAAGAEMKRLHDRAQESYRKALISLGVSFAFCVAAGVMLVRVLA